MQAVVFESNEKPLVLQDLPRPEPGPNELLLKVKACGICGSDIHAYQAKLIEEGIVFGHELAGEIVAVGEGAEGEWNVGDRVVAAGALICGSCPACQQGELAHCENIKLTGFDYNGAYAEYVVVQALFSLRVPDVISFQEAALVEPLATGLSAFRICELPIGGNILVVGAGIIGLAVAKWARFFGAEVVCVSDLDNERLERAKTQGATHVINAGDHADSVQAYRDMTGREPDVIVECVGRPMLQQLIDIAPIGTHIVAVGASMQSEPINSLAAAMKKVRISFAFGSELTDFEFIMRMIIDGRVITQGLVTRSVSLPEVPQAFTDLMSPNGHCKIMIEP